MKIIYTVLACLFFVAISNSQERFLTKNGTISFFSTSPMENIEAKNNQVLSIVDAANGQMAISILMKSFMFEKALMQEHFNENYVESDRYPKATFKGDLLNFDAIGDSKTKTQVKGNLTIHGKTKEITIEATTLKTADSILMTGEFFVELADFGIEIPAVVKNNIAKKIKVNFNFNHKPYKK
ncbi:YceI family protein [uncultured Polaribacter sp.]|uniref:YceI family protein n=1 Tax=uncultured Polaribacter sp. TaxID=174711 RepID=UPI00260E8C76|nr:YceI family protein [uncultured Polaribacter sp.]